MCKITFVFIQLQIQSVNLSVNPDEYVLEFLTFYPAEPIQFHQTTCLQPRI